MDKVLIYLIPIYVFAILTEYFSYNKILKSKKYNLKDTFSSITMGIGFLIVGILCKLFIIPLFLFLNAHALFQIPGTWVSLFNGNKIIIWPFILLLFLDDFAYYWFHRASHVIRFFWCAHETHHSSEYYNFGTALRQTWIGPPFTWIFWAPLALLGFKTEDILFQISLNLFFQFWIHTEYTKSFGFLDHIFNTPSHHRVHHGTNIPYLDKNYAGIFIIWDKIFKTFTPEKEKVIYGVLHPLNSFHPFYIGFHMVKDLMNDLNTTPGILNKIKTVFYPPGWRYDGTGLTSKDMQEKHALKLDKTNFN